MPRVEIIEIGGAENACAHARANIDSPYICMEMENQNYI
jgi:hypothetical protein